MLFCSALYAATTAEALVPIDVTDDALGLALAARIADCTLPRAVRICCTWGPNCDCAADWNSSRLVWMLPMAVCTPGRPSATLSDPKAATDVFSLSAAAQYAGVPLLGPPLALPPADPLPFVAAVLALGVGLAAEPPLLEQPAASVPASAMAATTLANRLRWHCSGRAGRSSVRDCSAPPMGYSYRRCIGRRRGLPERPNRPTLAAVASAVGGRAEIGPLTMRPMHHLCDVGQRDAPGD
jgi:hypothetical protein